MVTRSTFSFVFLACLTAFSAAGQLSSSSATVGVDDSGVLYDGQIGFQRNSDLYDPILPGTPRDSWSLFASGNGTAYADPQYYGTSNIDSSSYAGGNVSTSLYGGKVSLTQQFSFVAENVLHISGTVKNLSGGTQSFNFRRNVDFDIAPTTMAEFIDVPNAFGNVLETSYNGFESPVAPFLYTSTGISGPSDLGAGITLDLGTLANGASTTFDFYYAINKTGQSVADFKSQLAGLGIDYAIVGYSANRTDAVNSAALGVHIGTPMSSVPGPASVVAFGVGLAGRLRRRNRK